MSHDGSSASQSDSPEATLHSWVWELEPTWHSSAARVLAVTAISLSRCS